MLEDTGESVLGRKARQEALGSREGFPPSHLFFVLFLCFDGRTLEIQYLGRRNRAERKGVRIKKRKAAD